MSYSEYIVRRFVEGARWFWSNDEVPDVKLVKDGNGSIVEQTAPPRWTTNPYRAIRFSRREDAETIVRLHQQGDNPVVCEVGRLRLLEIE